MAESVPAGPERIRFIARPLTPIWSRKWRGFPATLGPLIGRERELAALRALLVNRRQRLITVTGPGGVGKTRLALEAAESVDEAFPDGAAFVPLAAIDDSTLILPTVAQILDVRDNPSRPLIDALIASLQERRMLLVLDNFEHLAGSAAIGDLSLLLQGCPELTILVTSRASLQLHHEQLVAIPPLALPRGSDSLAPDSLMNFGAISLFLSCARAVNGEFVLDDANSGPIVEICRRLDGLPLAIELAAAWVRVLSPATLLERLEPRLPLLTGGGHDQPARLRTMRDAIDWSYHLLTRDEKRLFRRLAVFTGGFGLEAAERVWEEGQSHQQTHQRARSAQLETLELLAGLVDKSLVQHVDPIGPASRFKMLETVREFALELLAECGEEASMAAAHASCYVSLAERIDPEILGPNERHWTMILDAEMGNLRAALAWSLEHDVESAMRIAAPLWVYWSVDGLAEGRRWLNAALASPSPAGNQIRASALTTDAALACLMGDFISSDQSAAAAAAMAEAAGDLLGEARARWVYGASLISSDRAAEAVLELERSLRLFEHATTSADHARRAYVQASLGAARLMLGDVEQGLANYEQALARVRASGSANISIVILSDFAGWLVFLGNPSRARHLLEEALANTAGHPELLLAAIILIGLALVDAVEGAPESAARRLGAVDSQRIQSGLVFPVHYQDRIDRAAGLARTALGEEPYTLAWAAGRSDPEVVIAAALDGSSAVATASRDESNATHLGLSRREREVLDLLIVGDSDREIAAALYISPRTASSHVSAILRKLEASSRAEAAVHAVRLGLV